MRIFGLTGGIATGKSTLVKLVRKNLEIVQIIDCDEIGRTLALKGQKGYQLYL